MGCCASDKKKTIKQSQIAYGSESRQPANFNQVEPEVPQQPISQSKYVQERPNDMKIEQIDQENDQEEVFAREIIKRPSKLVKICSENNESYLEIKPQQFSVNEEASTANQNVKIFKNSERTTNQDRTMNQSYQHQINNRHSLLVVCIKDCNSFEPVEDYDLVEDHFKMKMSNTKLASQVDKQSDNDEFEVI